MQDKTSLLEEKEIVASMFSIVPPSVVAERLSEGYVEFTCEEANAFTSLFNKLSYSGKLAVWELYQMKSGVYIVNEEPAAFFPPHGYWPNKIGSGRLLSVSPKDRSHYPIFIDWCRGKYKGTIFKVPPKEDVLAKLTNIHPLRMSAFIQVCRDQVKKVIDQQYFFHYQVVTPNSPISLADPLLSAEEYHGWLFYEAVDDYNKNIRRKVFEFDHRFFDLPMDNLESISWALWGYEAGLQAAEASLYLEDLHNHVNEKKPLNDFRFDYSDINQEIYGTPDEKQDSAVQAKQGHVERFYIHNKYLQSVVSILQGYFSEEDYTCLEGVLKGEQINRKLIFTNDGAKLLGIFWEQLHAKTRTKISHTEMNEWIRKSFKFRGPKGIQDFKESTVNKYLKGAVSKAEKPISGVSEIFAK